MSIKEQLEKLIPAAQDDIAQVKSAADLFAVQKKYLGRKGKLATIMKELKELEEGERREVGKLANQVKSALQQLFSHQQEMWKKKEREKSFLDVTWPGRGIERGHLHPITLMQRKLESIFSSLGFIIEDGPELESEYYNFDALNIPAYHPARDMQDTFFTTDGDVLRTHTSPIQIRAMEKYGAPLRLIAPGKVFRYEASDASHDFVFHQVEGLMIDKDISIANLLAIAKEFLSQIFGKDIEVRLRPGYFPFVEPGFEMDLTCILCQGKGCSACQRTGWMEFMGAGLVHPKVLKAGGIDPQEFSGFAFGFGLDRLIMLKYKIDDIRLFHSADIRFLEQF